MRIEKRQYPRYRVRLDARVRGFEMSTANLSVSGMQLVCPVMIYELIKNKLKADAEEVSLSLPDGQLVTAEFETLYIAEYGDEMLIGSRFTRLDGDVGALSAYIDQLGESGTPMT
jgi:hypothetical protein